MVKTGEELTKIRVEHPIHLLAVDPERHRCHTHGQPQERNPQTGTGEKSATQHHDASWSD
jgi:hypothetical protein